MDEYPKTLLEFEEKFSNEEACLEYLFRLRWPEGFICSQCGHDKAWNTKRKLLHCANCGFQTSITAGTIFQDTGKPLKLWFRAIWHLTNQKYGANALGLQRVLGLGSYRTAWAWIDLPPKKWTQRRVGINMVDTDSQTEVSYGREEAPAEAV